MTSARNLHPFSFAALQQQKERHGSSMKNDEKLILNVGGYRHEIMASTIAFAPDTRLYWVTQKKVQSTDYDPVTGEFFFDRNPLWFPYILNYYRLGKIHCPPDVCGTQFEEELQFWGIDESVIDSCCWDTYHKHKDADINLQTMEMAAEEANMKNLPDIENQIQQNSQNEFFLITDTGGFNFINNCINKYKPKIWTTLEDPNSSKIAQIYAFLSMLFIVVSVCTFCLETISFFEDRNSIQHNILFVIESLCVTWFSFEVMLRIIVSPSKGKFFKNIMNWIDFCAIIPYFISLAFTDKVKTIIILRIVRLVRVFRILKLSRHSYGLQILGHTLRASFRELCLLAFFLTIAVIIFSSLIYYAEKETNSANFTSIPSAFWWSVITMTTVGYGDVVPTTNVGKLIGALCAICGVLVIALPVPVVASNFSMYYSHAQSKIRTSDSKKGREEKNETSLAMNPWFNLGFTNRSSLVSVFSRNSFYVSSPVPGTPSRLSTHQAPYSNGNFLSLRNNSIPNTPLHSPSYGIDSSWFRTPLVSRRNSFSPKAYKESNLDNSVFRYEFPYNNVNNNNENRIALPQDKLLNTNYPEIDFTEQSGMPTTVKTDKLTINVFPPSYSGSETDEKQEEKPMRTDENILRKQPQPQTKLIEKPFTEDVAYDFPVMNEKITSLPEDGPIGTPECAQSQYLTPSSVQSSGSSKSNSSVLTLPVDKKNSLTENETIDVLDYGKGQYLSPSSHHSLGSSTSVSPLSTHSTPTFDYNEYYPTYNSFESPLDHSSIGSRVGSISSKKTLFRILQQDINKSSFPVTPSPAFENRDEAIYRKKDNQTLLLQEASKRLQDYIVKKEQRNQRFFNLSPVDKSRLYARRQLARYKLSSDASCNCTSSAYSSSAEDCGVLSPMLCPSNATTSTVISPSVDYSCDSFLHSPLAITPRSLKEDNLKSLKKPEIPPSPKILLKPRNEDNESSFFSFEKSSRFSPTNSKPEEEIESSYIDSEFGEFNRNTLDSLDSSRSGDESKQKCCMFSDRCKRKFGSFPFEPSQIESLTNDSPLSKERKRYEKKRNGKYKSSPDLYESKL